MRRRSDKEPQKKLREPEGEGWLVMMFRKHKVFDENGPRGRAWLGRARLSEGDSAGASAVLSRGQERRWAERGRPGRGEPQRLAREQSRGEPKARAQAPLGAHRALTSDSQYHARGTLKAHDNGS